MTARADPLTKRAKTPRSAGSVRSSYPASGARVFADALERLNYSVESLLADAGIRRADLDDPDARIPCAVWGPMFRRALEQRPMKNPGMRLATVTPIGAFPLIDFRSGDVTPPWAVCSSDRRTSQWRAFQQWGAALEVRRALASRIGRGDTRIQAIAGILATSTRSLQRRLAAAGVSYQQLLDLSRRDAAERYLTDSLLSIGEVAYLLGYSEPAAFNRAFRRWHHEPPQAFRLATRSSAGRESVEENPDSFRVTPWRGWSRG